ncbi:fungal specific transcription factor domain-containing protein [Sarocladium implicatum]|nr:fungal specific transcription factor domain-containing protein [Sarocladium implicatum]
MTDPEGRKRRRPAVRRKLKCSRETPCSSCVRSKTACIYDNPPPLGWARNPEYGFPQAVSSQTKPISTPTTTTDKTSSQPESELVSSPSGATTSTAPTQLSGHEVESLKGRIRDLEQQLSAANLRTNDSPTSRSRKSYGESEYSTTRLCDSIHLHSAASPGTGETTGFHRNLSHKTRLFGQTHWINVISLFQEICEPVEPYLNRESNEVSSGLRRCKALARFIKAQLAPARHLAPAADLPPKDVADELVDCYLRTSESVYRVLHVPSFRQSYEALWVRNNEVDPSFRILLKLVLAIGAITYDEQFTMRASAVRWVYEAHSWLCEPQFKARLNIQALQINILLLIAREMSSVGGDQVWIDAGALLRRSMSMGFHRDPTFLPNRSVLVLETRRRLWNTIIELILRTSLSSGGPPLISLDDFDTQPPRNFDDDQLMAQDPVPKSVDEFTQVSIPIILRKSFATRLAIAKFLNDLSSKGTYEETLRLDGELRLAFKEMHQNFQKCTSSPNGISSSALEIRIVRFLMHRWMTALHAPFLGPASRTTSYAYSKSVVTDMSLKLWYAAYPPSTAPSTRPDSRGFGPNGATGMYPCWDELARLVTNGSGFYRTVALHASLLLTAVLHAQLKEDESTGFGSPLRPDLLSVLDDAKVWCLKCLQSGETNVRGNILICVLKTAIDGPLNGIPQTEMTPHLFKAAGDAVAQCLPILEEKAAQYGADVELEMVSSEGAQTSTDKDTPQNMGEEWDFMLSDAGMFINFEDADTMNWAFNTEFS